jgi:low affinity Fe/Cu permease
MDKKRNIFTRFAAAACYWTGSSKAFVIAVAVILTWAITGPLFNFSDTWQLVINTSTTIITFLMVFLIQNSQNRDTRALQIKLDELIRVTEGAHTALMDLEELSDVELRHICKRYEQLAQKSRQLMRHGVEDTHIPDIKEFNAKMPKKKTAKKK